jgi:mannose-6-phosphate isomerase-like protein (cupin superfamily)
MKVDIDDIQGELIRDTDVYQVLDNRHLNNLVLSMTKLNPGKETGGHSHAGLEEVYFFTEGSGEMQLGDDRFPITKGNVVLIPDGLFHKVYNTSDELLTFVCVFQAYER